jgi:hypothetical protein
LTKSILLTHRCCQNQLVQTQSFPDAICCHQDFSEGFVLFDVIISVGYRVKSLRGTTFRKWATKVLKEYMLKGIVVQQLIDLVEKFVII